MQFTGDALSDRCPISFARVVDIEHPVGFSSKHAFECTMLVHWLTRCSATNPITSETVRGKRVSDVLRPLVVLGERAHVGATQAMLDEAGSAMGADDDDLAFRRFAMIAHGVVLACVGVAHMVMTCVGVAHMVMTCWGWVY
jgi:hypothetical protein